MKQKLQWCPQPPKKVDKKLSRYSQVSPRLLALVILAEIITLLVAPLTYYALLAPSTLRYDEGQEVALTDEQIRKAWPNLPSGDAIKNGSIPYVCYLGTLGPILENRTRINMPANFGVSKVPIAYLIYVQDSVGSWVEVPTQYLNTSNPPELQQNNVASNNLPITCVIITATVALVTLAIGSSYLLMRRKHHQKV